MYRHISNPPSGSLFGKEQTKDTKITEFLQAIPSLSSSTKGFSDIANRFNIIINELKQYNSEHEAREELHDE